MWKDKIKKDLITNEKERNSLKDQVLISLRNVKANFRKSLLILLFTLCFLFFLIMGKYNVVRLWFPQLSTIVEHSQMNADQDLCVLLDKYTGELKLSNSNATNEDYCVPTKSGTETYTNNMIIGLVSLLPHFITGALVNKVGKKALLVTLCLISAGAISGVRWANSRTAVVALFSLDIAITQSIKSLIQAVTIEFFPTAVRTLTISLVMTFARIGTLVGNVLFPILLDIQCIIPFFSMAGIMTFVTLVTLFLPKKKEK
ncbi:putative transporter SVOPL [Bombyx mandarina]|nr:putative transporter SVOPL [Bombyx mandarina]